ncbi:MAG TPA: hypothetical protein VLQ80_12295, partial [Candidatus Saccharimonadia bacterium]|nr:hypothetical protein [Candidatus Saccharimonadia bacterium]
PGGDPFGVRWEPKMLSALGVDENGLAGHTKSPFLAGHGSTGAVQVLRTRQLGQRGSRRVYRKSRANPLQGQNVWG